MRFKIPPLEKKLFEYSLLYSLLLFIPLTSLGYYFEVRYFSFLLNKNILLVGLFIMFIIALKQSLFNKNEFIVYIITFYALGMIAHNFILLFSGVEPNYFVAGFFLLTISIIYRISTDRIINLLKYYAIILILYTFFLFFDSFMGSSILPLYEIRYVVISETQATFRWTFSVLFGQKNAAGAILAVLIMLLVYFYKYYQCTVLMAILIFGVTFILFITNSATGIIMVLFFLLLYAYIISNKFFKTLIFLILFVSIIIIIVTNIDVLSERKFLSLIIKLNAILQYLLFISQNPECFFFGNLGEHIYTESSFIDLIINFGIIIPLMLLLFVVYCIFKSLHQKDLLLAYVFFAIIFLMIISGSTFMPPTIILLLIAIRFIKEFNRRQMI